jgi:hypothetical protein
MSGGNWPPRNASLQGEKMMNPNEIAIRVHRMQEEWETRKIEFHT